MKNEILTFNLGDLTLGIELKQVKEMNRNITYTMVPESPEHIVGLMNMRGDIVTLFDLAALLDLKITGQPEQLNGLVLKKSQNDQDYFGFVIHSADSVLEINDDICEQPPKKMKDLNVKYIKKIAKLKDQLIMIIHYDLLKEKMTEW
ncbi:MAG: chemotaxis protein CheW [Bacillaceae bacterium]|nr:chemotaxis protein CheW [Bacillaceae bacterium]